MKEIKSNCLLDTVSMCSGEEVQATREFLTKIADKWSILVVVILSKSPNHKARFSEIKKVIEGISQTMLTSTLRNLEKDGMLVREIFPEIPPRVEYQLTKLGLSVLEPMKNFMDWVTNNWDEVKESRKKFEEKENNRK